MGDATDMEHDTGEGTEGDATVNRRIRAWRGGDTIDTKEEPGGGEGGYH